MIFAVVVLSFLVGYMIKKVWDLEKKVDAIKRRKQVKRKKTRR